MALGPLGVTGTAFIRIAWQPMTGPNPVVTLTAGGGATAIPFDGMTHSVLNAAGDHAGDAILGAAVGGVFLLRIFLDNTGVWEMEIANGDAAPHAMTWVVADSDEDSRQPWIHTTFHGAAPVAVLLDAVVGQHVDAQIQIANLGTGPFTVSGVTPAIAAPYTLAGVPAIVAPNAGAPAVITVGFDAPATPGDRPETIHALVTAGKVDPGPFGTVHNNRIGLRAHTRLDAPTLADPPNQFQPVRGRAAGEQPGREVTLFGTHLNEGSVSVRFGTVEAPIVSKSPTRIVTTVPEMAPGIVKVTITTGGGSVISRDNFVVLPVPVIESIDPDNGRPGDKFSVLGTDFLIDPGDTVAVIMSFPTEPGMPQVPPLTIVGRPTSFEIVVVVPVVTREISVPIVVSRSDGAEASSSDKFQITLL